MRILMLTHNMAGLGGSFLRAHSLAKSLVKRGHNVTLMASRRHPGWRRIREEIDGVTVVQMVDFLPARARHGGLSPVDLIGRLMASDTYDLVHGFDHRPTVSIPAFWARRRKRVPYVADWADLWGKGGIAEERRTRWGQLLGLADHHWELYVHRRADAVTVVSRNLASRAEVLGIPPERVQLVQVGANVDVIRPLPKTDMRHKYGLPQSALVVVHSGFAPYDARLLAETFALLARRNHRVMLLLTGKRLTWVDRIARAAGVSDRVRYLGIVPYHQLGEILACGDVMLLPLGNRRINAARYPNRVGDYLAAGRPIATNPAGEIARLIEAEGVGVLAEDDAQSFAAAIEALLENEKLRHEMGVRARALAETRLSWSAVAEPLEDLYRRVSSCR